MAGPGWLDSGAAGMTYANAPRPTGGVSVPKMRATPGSTTMPGKAPTSVSGPKPPSLGTSEVPGAGVPPKLETKAPAPTAQPQTNTAVNSAVEGAKAYGNYQTGAWTASKLMPSATTAGSTLAKRIPAVYGAYALGDAMITPINLAMGTDNLEDLQQGAVHNSYLSSAGTNLTRPGRAAWGLLGSGYDTVTNGVRQWWRGRQLDAKARAPRPTSPWSDAGSSSGGGSF